MPNINKNISLRQFKKLIQKDIHTKFSHFPDSFYQEQKRAIEIFNKRIFLEEVIEESIAFNKKLSWDYDNQSLKLTTTVEELIDVFKLRSNVFTDINYQKEFPDTIEGLNFDKYDKSSAIIYYKSNNIFTGTIRLIFDSKNKLPSEKICSFDNIRKDYSFIGEISRNIVKNRKQGLNQEFKYLMCGVYNIFINNNVNIALSGIRKDHLKLFKKLGGVDIYKEIDSYGSLDIPFLIISYNPDFASKFFKKVFLGEKVS